MFDCLREADVWTHINRNDRNLSKHLHLKGLSDVRNITQKHVHLHFIISSAFFGALHALRQCVVSCFNEWIFVVMYKENKYCIEIRVVDMTWASTWNYHQSIRKWNHQIYWLRWHAPTADVKPGTCGRDYCSQPFSKIFCNQNKVFMKSFHFIAEAKLKLTLNAKFDCANGVGCKRTWLKYNTVR